MTTVKPDPKKLGTEVNALMLYVHNRTAEDIISALQAEMLNPNPLGGINLEPEQAYVAGLNKAKEIAKAQIKDAVTLK
jgi:hypothetical protein